MRPTLREVLKTEKHNERVFQALLAMASDYPGLRRDEIPGLLEFANTLVCEWETWDRNERLALYAREDKP